MFMLIGQPDDACLRAVEAVLRERGHTAAIISSPFARPARSTWSIPASPAFNTTLRAGAPVEIEGVLCRGIGEAAAPAPDAPGWTADDLAYMRAEADAALLGWLTGLPCRVVDRVPAWLWYNTRPALHGWSGTLAAAGLAPLDAVTTADPAAITALLEGPGTAWMPLTGFGARYPVGPVALPELIETARLTPVHLSTAHHGAWRACVLGAQHIVWDDATPAPAQALDPLLRRFAASAGLDAVELVVTAAPPGEARTIDLAARPRFDIFGPAAQASIADRLATLLCDGAGS